MTTWLDAIDANRFDGWTHTILLTEDQRTLFRPSPRPVNPFNRHPASDRLIPVFTRQNA
jgi:hypothetical protein